MSETDLLAKLVERCKGSVFIDFNGHRDAYWLIEDEYEEELKECEEDIKNKILETKEVLVLHFYPRGATSFYRFIHYDLTEALKLAHKTLDEE